jgi:hypothetical protein
MLGSRFLQAATADPSLVLRDIHSPPAPPLWPPAPGWWVLAALVLTAVLALAWRGWRRHRRRRAILRLFDDTLRQSPTPAARIAAMSLLLRRAALRRDPESGALDGDAWIAFLDRGSREPLFDDDDAQWLLEGGYRREADPAAVERLLPRVRARLLEWTAR